MSAVIRGAKGGGSTHTPVESADNLRSIAFFRILDLVSEGEIGGLVNGQQSIFLDETPLGNNDGTSNFPNAHIEQRTGTQDQDAIPGFDAVENEISVGVELTSASAWLHSVSDTTLSALRVTLSVPALSKANTSNGDITGYTIAYKIEISTDGGAFAAAYNGSFTGKTTTKFQRSHRLDLPTATTGWQVRVTRLTANAHSSAIADTTTVDSYTEIVDAKLRYPNSALIGVMGDASQFSNIPQRAYDLWGRIVQVPSNYDVTTRAYTGVWDGTFKPSWTDNPAWIFYDLVTHPRYGLGHLVAAAQVDKWELYRIGQYCDGMVADGNGGTEPRLTCNVYLQTQADAYKLLNDLSSAFRGISYWANGTIVASADMPADPVYTYTDANVIEGKFSYSASARKTRYTTALVSWNDPRNFYRTKVEYVEDRDGIARYGIQQTEVTAVGCASQGQAQRLGRWILLTSRYETDTVTFSVGLDGTLAAPGQIIRIADSARAGKRQGGRVHSATTTTVTVDKTPTVAIGDSLTVIMSDGVSQTRTVSGVSGAVITVSTAFSEAPAAQSMWVVESAELTAQTFRVLSVTEDKSDADMSFTLTCLQHNASKFSAVDTGTIIQVPPVSALTPKPQEPPATVTISEAPVIVQGTAQTMMTISWDAAAGAASYDVEWRRDDGQWISAGNNQGLAADVLGVYTGTYTARVRSRNSVGDASIWKYSSVTDVVGKTALPPDVILTATGGQLEIVLNWVFPTTSNVDDTSYTEIWMSETSTFADGHSLGFYAYPVNTATITGLLPLKQLWFWARLVDKSQNVGAWSSPPATAIGGDVSDLFAPVQSQIDTLNADVVTLNADVATLVETNFPRFAGEASNFIGDTTIYAGVWTETTIRLERDNEFAQTVSLIGVAQADKRAFILNGDTVKIDANTTLAQSISSTQAQLGSNVAAISSESTTRASADSALSSSITSLTSTVGSNTAAISSEATTRASADTANATAINAVSVRMPAGTGTVATAASVTAMQGQLNASYTLSLDVNGYVAGFVAQNTGTVSNFIIVADNFQIVKPGGGARTEFSSGNWRVYDSSGALRVRMGVW